MAESVVSFVLENLSRLLAHEANLLRGVDEKVKLLQSELNMMSVFLKSCHQNQRKKGIEHEVVRQITEVAHEAEDVIDTFVVNVAIYRSKNWLSKIAHAAEQGKLRHTVSEQIDSIKARLNEIHEHKLKYDTQQEEAGSSIDQELKLLHKRRREVEEDDVVGFQHDTTQVINLLKQGGSSRNVVSIIGMGGLGKTTLARKVYNSHDVKYDFECHAWVYVSNDYRPIELLHALLKCFMSFPTNSHVNDNSLSEEGLKDKVRKCLKGKKYFVVLDDIWNPQHWDDIHDAFPDDNKSSRILITSRVTEVATNASSVPPYCLPFLDEDQSWALFSKRVFRGEVVPPDLEELGKHMVKCCGGLPLSIVVLAGVVNRKKSFREWSKIAGHVNSYLTQPETQVHQILKLSYDCLPSRLKPCFLYFGMFPEDYEIPARRLIRLWVAEGFILHSDSRLTEDVAEEDYLDELIDCNLIQVGKRRSDGGIKTCRIHDLLRELCISMSKEEEVFEVCEDLNILKQTKPRRLSIQCNIPDYFSSSNKDHSRTRSVICFHRHYHYCLLSRKSRKRIVEWFKLVRVLDLGPLEFHNNKNLTDFNMLVHLRYLRLVYYVEEIPESICNLWNLECLELGAFKDAVTMQFPSGMWKLKRLRHLHTYRHMVLPEFPNIDSKTMWNLQTLSNVAIDKKSAIMSLIGKGVFPKLRVLGLFFTKSYQQKQRLLQFWEILSNLNDLTSLNIRYFPYIPTFVHDFPLNLAKLTIKWTNLSSDVMGTLGSLTNLRILKLWDCEVDGSKLCCIKGFPKLDVFQMQKMSNLRLWELGKDVMPWLKRLIIEDCNLTCLPDVLWSLAYLQVVRLRVRHPSDLLKMRLRSHPMRDGCNLIISDY